MKNMLYISSKFNLTRSQQYRCIYILCFIFFSLSLQYNLSAQQNILDLRMFEINENGDHTYSNFIFSKYFDELIFNVYHLQTPSASDYKETGIGVGLNMQSTENFVLDGILNTVFASDDSYLLPAFIISFKWEKFSATIIPMYYFPLSDKGIVQIALDPAEIDYNFENLFSLGFSIYYWYAQTDNHLLKYGPKIGLSDNFGKTELRIADNSEQKFEFQFRRLFFF